MFNSPFSIPGLSDFGLERCRQINTLLIFNENVSIVQQDYHYRVDFISDGKPLSLSILLPNEYPFVRPNIYLEPRGVFHPWVREDGAVVGAPGLIMYSNQTDLGQLVQMIKRGLERNPPIFPRHAMFYEGAVYGSYWQGQGQLQRGPAYQIAEGASMVQGMDLNYMQFQNLSYDDFNDLNATATASALQHFLRSAEQQPVPMDLSLDIICDQIQRTSPENHERQSHSNQLMIQVDNIHNARNNMESTVARIKNFTKNLIEFMQDENETFEKKSEVITETFLDGGVEADDFLKEYLKARTVLYKKRGSANRIQN